MSSQFLTFLPRLRTGRHPIDLTVFVVFVGFVIATSKDKTSEQPGPFLITSKSAWFRNEQYEYLIYRIWFIYDIIYCKSCISADLFILDKYTRIHLNITWTSIHTSPHPFGPLKYQNQMPRDLRTRSYPRVSPLPRGLTRFHLELVVEGITHGLGLWTRHTSP